MPFRCPVFAAVMSKHIDITTSNTPHSCNASDTALPFCSPEQKLAWERQEAYQYLDQIIELEGDVHVVLMSNLATAFHPSEL